MFYFYHATLFQKSSYDFGLLFYASAKHHHAALATNNVIRQEQQIAFYYVPNHNSSEWGILHNNSILLGPTAYDEIEIVIS